MAVNFKLPNGNCTTNSNIEYTITSENTTIKTLNFSRNTNERLLYINYPESILSNTKCFANVNAGNKYLFQTTLNANETVQLFFSHHNRTGSNMNYAILIYNPNSQSTTATVSASNFGYAYGWNKAEFIPWADFYNGNSTSINVRGQSTGFLLDWRNIKSASDPFSGIMRIKSNYAVTLTVYAWTGSDPSILDGDEEQFPYNKDEKGNSIDKDPAAKYTGTGAGYYLTVSNTVTYNDVKTKTGGMYYALASCSDKNTNEIIPIALSGANLTAQKGAAPPLNNLGNWGAQYQFSTTLDNSLNSSTKTYRCYIGRNALEGKFVIRYNGTTAYCSMGQETSTMGKAYKWNFMDVTVAARSKETVNFQLVHATCSSSPIYLQWI